MHGVHQGGLIHGSTLATRPERLQVAAVERKPRVLNRLVDISGDARHPGLQSPVVQLDNSGLAGPRAAADRDEFGHIRVFEPPRFVGERHGEGIGIRTQHMIQLIVRRL